MSTPRFLTRAALLGGLAASAATASAQDPVNEPGRPAAAANSAELVARMLKFDKNGDGKLTKAEITDARLIRLFTRADADNDGTVTQSELEALDARERGNQRASFGGPGGGPGGPDGGPGGPMGAPPRPGEVLPQMIRARLKLTTDQQAQLDELQRDVDARMGKILTDSQMTQVKQMGARGPGGPGGPGGRGPGGGRGGPGFDDGGAPPPPPR